MNNLNMVTKQEMKNMKKQEILKAILHNTSEAQKIQEQKERQERVNEIHNQHIEKLYEWGWKNGKTKRQTMNKYQDLIFIGYDEMMKACHKITEIIEA